MNGKAMPLYEQLWKHRGMVEIQRVICWFWGASHLGDLGNGWSRFPNILSFTVKLYRYHWNTEWIVFEVTCFLLRGEESGCSFCWLKSSTRHGQFLSDFSENKTCIEWGDRPVHVPWCSLFGDLSCVCVFLFSFKRYMKWPILDINPNFTVTSHRFSRLRQVERPARPGSLQRRAAHCGPHDAWQRLRAAGKTWKPLWIWTEMNLEWA